MSGDLRPLIGLAADRPLTRDEAERAFEALFDGAATPSQMGGLLMALRTRGETVEEYAAVAVFLLSAQASYLTGSVIRVDGGFIRAT